MNFPKFFHKIIFFKLFGGGFPLASFLPNQSWNATLNLWNDSKLIFGECLLGLLNVLGLLTVKVEECQSVYQLYTYIYI